MRPISRINWRRLKRQHDYFLMEIVALFIFDPRARLSGVLRFVATTKRPRCAINRPRPSSRFPDNAVCRPFKDTDQNSIGECTSDFHSFCTSDSLLITGYTFCEFLRLFLSSFCFFRNFLKKYSSGFKMKIFPFSDREIFFDLKNRKKFPF